jgi:hypothetical protein
MIKKVLAAFAAAAGLACAIIGMFVITDPGVKSISGFLTGIGTAAFALGLGNFIRLAAVPESKRDEQERLKDIEVHDERNIRIKEKAGAAVNRAVFYALCAAVLVFGLLGDVRAVLVITGMLVMEFVLIAALTGYYSKRI